ncbi:effector-associated domain EAD1-containing protein [Phormidesmis sp. 146-12]
MGKWELFGKQVEELEAALGDAFAQEDDLKQMLRKRLNLRWDSIKKGDTYESRLFELIEWFESKGNIDKFIIEVANCKSENRKIQRFIETYIDKLFEFDNIDRLSAELLTKLLTILKSIPDFMSVWGICRKILPSTIEVDRAQKIQAFGQSELSNWFKCLTLLMFLLEDYPTSKQRPSILVFVQSLSESSALEDVIKNQLSEWLQEVDPQQNDAQTGLSNSFEQGNGGLQAYLMITLSPEKSKMRSLATLYCVAPTGDTKEIPVNLDPQSTERGVLSTWKKVPQTIAQFVEQAISNELEKPENRLGCAYYALTVELFLPHQYLNERVDQWKIKDGFGNFVPLIVQHRLVVRSQDRVVKPNLRNAFSQSWHRAKKILQENPQPASLRENIEHLSQLDCLRFGALQENLKEKIGIKITCSLPQSQKEMLKFLQAILGSGIPLAVWAHDCELSSSELEQRFDQFLTVDLLCSPCNLIEKVKKQRVSSFDDSENPQTRWGRHLTLLWDDFERMPVSEPFQSRGERSA